MDRIGFLNEDQLVGQVCTCAATIYLFGVEDGFKRYNLIRESQNSHPNSGDGGDDIPPLGIDVKGSKARNNQKKVTTYNLLVRPRERHEGCIYVLSLTIPPKVLLVGWEEDSHLPSSVESSGIFEGAYRVVGSSLRPMHELKPHLIAKEKWDSSFISDEMMFKDLRIVRHEGYNWIYFVKTPSWVTIFSPFSPSLEQRKTILDLRDYSECLNGEVSHADIINYLNKRLLKSLWWKRAQEEYH